MTRAFLVPLLGILLVACAKESSSDDELGEGESGDTTGTDGDTTDTTTDTTTTDSGGSDDELGDDLGTDETTADETTADETTADETTGDETTGDGDCDIGEYIPYFVTINGPSISGQIDHLVTQSVIAPAHRIDANFYTSDFIDDSVLCVEPLVELAGVDSCEVWYTQGQGKGGETPMGAWYEDLAVDTVSFNIGDGPVALVEMPAGEFNPTYYAAAFADPPAGVPFGEVATLAATFQDLPDLELDLDVPNQVLPLNHALDVATLTSDELASWTWSTPGGTEPIELLVRVGASPNGISEWLEIRCEVSDDGEFAFPSEYVDYATERMGSELYAFVRLSRSVTGTAPLAGKDLLWRSVVDAYLHGVPVID